MTSAVAFTFADNTDRVTTWLLGKMLKPQLPPELTDTGKSISVLGWVIFGLVITAVAALITQRRVNEDDGYAAAGPIRKDAQSVYRREIELGPKYRLSRLHRDLLITKDYDACVTEYFDMEAMDAPVAGICAEFGSGNVPVPEGTERLFKASIEGGEELLLTVPALDEPNMKQFLSVIVPPLMPQAGARKIHHESHWPNAAKKLKEKGLPDRNGLRINPRVGAEVATVFFAVDLELTGTFRFDVECPRGRPEGRVETKITPRRCEVTASNVAPGLEIHVIVTRVD